MAHDHDPCRPDHPLVQSVTRFYHRGHMIRRDRIMGTDPHRFMPVRIEQLAVGRDPLHPRIVEYFVQLLQDQEYAVVEGVVIPGSLARGDGPLE